MNPATKAVSRAQQIERTTMIRRTLGVRAAAGYLRRHEWTLDKALFILLGPRALERLAMREASCAR